MASTTELFKAEIDFIDAMECGSTVGYKVSTHYASYKKKHYAYGTVYLTDCGRKIEWELPQANEGKGAVDKINKAIQILTRAKNALIAANKLSASRNKKGEVPVNESDDDE
jgi:hypothetical protein